MVDKGAVQLVAGFDNNNKEDVATIEKYQLHVEYISSQEDELFNLNGRRIVDINEFISSIQKINHHGN